MTVEDIQKQLEAYQKDQKALIDQLNQILGMKQETEVKIHNFAGAIAALQALLPKQEAEVAPGDAKPVKVARKAAKE